jgi:nitroreductase
VPIELIENAIATAGTSPSGAHQQPWTFVVVSNPELKRQLREAAEAEERRFYESRASAEWLKAIRPIGTDAVKSHITDAPYVIVVFEQAYGLDGTRKVKHYYVRESVGIAVGYLLASLQAAGLVALTHTPSPMGFLSRILDRPENERPFVLIPVGYPAAEAEVPDIDRKPLEEIMVRFE